MRPAYTTEAELTQEARESCEKKAQAANKPIDPAIIDTWVQTVLERARAAGRILTPQQLADYKAGRTLALGDRAKYVGPERTETVGNQQCVRPTGQTGVIVDVKKQKDEEIVTFQPHAHNTEHVVQLVVKTNTRGYFDLERLP